ncbi:putative ATP-binding cassette transporter-like protein [Paenibacillus marchantiophytorum]|uniref:ATP-binding cassette transporter-like protein n=1 Tax=Paenibacillus marchantiophytorum TaxID=1619310 RepID=A0ABQ1F9R9_9BACL|nr:efflux RND transporter periplasmic adaptor subunit [Paenibacillus marchantiophytorum]GGA03510.1 putative ATP-binding cassette transporter-like protein [Paenibacillus marchantiophytorum]
MKQKLILTIGILTIAAIISINVVSSKKKSYLSNSPSVKIIHVKKERISDTLIASGVIVQREEEKKYYDETKGQITHWYVFEGQQILKGTALFQYDGEDLKKQKKQLEITGSRLVLQMEQTNKKIKYLNTQFKESVKDSTSLDETISKVAEQKDDLERELKLSELEIQQNDIEKDLLDKKLDQLVVKSTISGIVKKITIPKAGQSELNQQPCINIVSGTFQVRGSISEFDSVYVKAGQQVLVKPKVLSNQVWKGVIKYIELASITNNSTTALDKGSPVTSYPFVVELIDTQDGLQDGYHVALEIHIKEKEGVLTIPNDAVLIQDQKEIVYIVENGKLYKKNIETGFTNDLIKEVTAGVREGDVVVRNPLPGWKDGMDVLTDDTTD